MKKIAVFDQKHGLTPLKKCDFWDVEKFCCFSQKRFVFYLGHHSTLFLVLFWLKTNKEKNSIFWPKAWVNPFGKMPFLRLWIFFKKKFVFYLKHHSTSFLVLFDRKQIKKKNMFFDQKQGLNTLEKMPFFETLKNLVFIVKKVSFLSKTLCSIISSLILTENK